ncbi:MAG: hypothetical protein EXR67_03925 [Dehalococcoidia bacterium]|nr:hypothetical protein [Dehalococcoidia bacterium]
MLSQSSSPAMSPLSKEAAIVNEGPFSPNPSQRLSDRLSFRSRQAMFQVSPTPTAPRTHHSVFQLPKFRISSPAERTPLRAETKPPLRIQPKEQTRQEPEPKPVMRRVHPEIHAEIPHVWTWEDWGQQSERDMARVSRGLEIIASGAAGALIGVTIATAPLLTDQAAAFPYLFTIPAGATVGMLAGYVLGYKRWSVRRH